MLIILFIYVFNRLINAELIRSAVVVMRRSRTASCHAGLTDNKGLLGQSTWDATWDAVAYSWCSQSQLWVESGAVYNGPCKPQSCQKQKDNYSTVNTLILLTTMYTQSISAGEPILYLVLSTDSRAITAAFALRNCNTQKTHTKN